MGIHIMPPLYEMVIKKGYGPAVTVKFYPTAGHTGVAADGEAERWILTNGETWANIHDGAGTGANDDTGGLGVAIVSGWNTNTWIRIVRCPLHFDTTLLPVVSKILSAQVIVAGANKLDQGNWQPDTALVESTDPTPGSVVAADYQNMDIHPLADIITYGNFVVGENYFPLHTHHLDLIIGGGVTKFALREYTHDCLNAPPTWSSHKTAYLGYIAADASLPGPIGSPYLKVTYQPPL